MHTYIHVSYHKESLLRTSLCFKTHLNIIIDVKNKELLHSITVTAKSIKKRKESSKLKIL